MKKFVAAVIAIFTFSQTAHAVTYTFKLSVTEHREGLFLAPFIAKEEFNLSFDPSDVRIVGGASLMAFSTLPLLASLAQFCAAENGTQLTKSLITGAVGTLGFSIGASMLLKGLNS